MGCTPLELPSFQAHAPGVPQMHPSACGAAAGPGPGQPPSQSLQSASAFWANQSRLAESCHAWGLPSANPGEPLKIYSGLTALLGCWHHHPHALQSMCSRAALKAAQSHLTACRWAEHQTACGYLLFKR